jgi:hypothetical protein
MEKGDGGQQWHCHYYLLFVCVVCVLADKISTNALCRGFCVEGMQEEWSGSMVQGI